MEGYSYEDTLKQLNAMFGGDDNMDEGALNDAVPQGIKDVCGYKDAIIALGSTLW